MCADEYPHKSSSCWPCGIWNEGLTHKKALSQLLNALHGKAQHIGVRSGMEAIDGELYMVQPDCSPSTDKEDIYGVIWEPI